MAQELSAHQAFELLHAVWCTGGPFPDHASIAGWKRDCEAVIARVYPNQPQWLADFRAIQLLPDDSVTDAARRHDHFHKAVEAAQNILQSMVREQEREKALTAGRDENGRSRPHEPTAVEVIQKLADRFHSFARKLAERPRQRQPVEIIDEADVQWLFYAALQLDFDDVRKESPSPEFAGAGSRIDFWLPKEGIAIETKMTRPSMTKKQLGEELAVDIRRYPALGGCRTVFFFVYDPDGRIDNPRGIENDLSRSWDGLQVVVAIRPRK